MAQLTVQLVGGPTALLAYAGARLLTDPTFDPPQVYRTGSVTLTKVTGPALSPAAIGPVDAVLISHDHHADNLDTAGRALAGGMPRVLTTVAGAARLGPPARGLRPHDQVDLGDVRITAVPAPHGSPEVGLTNGPVIGFVLESPGQPTVYVSGDNASLDVVAGIAERFPGIEVAVLHLGAAKVPARGDVFLTLTADDAVRAAALLGVRAVVPVHQEGWLHFTQGPDRVVRAFGDAGRSDLLVDLRAGASATL